VGPACVRRQQPRLPCPGVIRPLEGIASPGHTLHVCACALHRDALCRGCGFVSGTCQETLRRLTCDCAAFQAKRRVACGVALEDLAPVMHVAETWEEPDVNCAVVRTSR
jgi:hypothetical protein